LKKEPDLLVCASFSLIFRHEPTHFPPRFVQHLENRRPSGQDDRMTLRAIDAAQTILEAAQRLHKQGPTPVALMMLVYLAHGWHLALNDRALISDQIVAAPDGPWIGALAQALRTSPAAPVVGVMGGSGQVGASEDRAVIEQVTRSYGNWSAAALSSVVMARDTPWAVVHALNPAVALPIANAQLNDHFRRLLYDSHPHAAASEKSPAVDGAPIKVNPLGNVIAFPSNPIR
jgi:uncharacterized phage-associated protein